MMKISAMLFSVSLETAELESLQSINDVIRSTCKKNVFIYFINLDTLTAFVVESASSDSVFVTRIFYFNL